MRGCASTRHARRKAPLSVLRQIADGLAIATRESRHSVERYRIRKASIRRVPPTAPRVFSGARGSTAGTPIGQGLPIFVRVLKPRLRHSGHISERRQRGRFSGATSILFSETKAQLQGSVSAIIGTGLGGGVIVGGKVVTGRKGFGGELGHVLIPYRSIEGIEGMRPECNCGRIGDLESLCSLTAINNTLLPYLLKKKPRSRTEPGGRRQSF